MQSITYIQPMQSTATNKSYEEMQLTKAVAYLKSAYRSIEAAPSQKGALQKKAASEAILQARRMIEELSGRAKVIH